MRIFAYEHVTGGGMAAEELPPALAHEADLILRALVTDLLALGVEVWTSRDPRLAPVPGAGLLAWLAGESSLELFDRGLESVDAAWPTAPESGGVLEQLARRTIESGRLLLGSRPEAIRLAASKRATARRLLAAGIPAAEAWTRDEPLRPTPGPWILKPDDGAGCEGVRRAEDWRGAARELETAPPGLIAQPMLDGESHSLCLLCADGRARVLSVNRQRVTFGEGTATLEGLEVNALPILEQHRQLADRVAAAIPGLWGCVGVDFIAGPRGPTVIEVNPRLTTSFTALRAATGVNPARLVLGLAAGAGLGAEDCGGGLGRPVEIPLGGLHVR